MADTKITALAAITTVDPAADVLPIVDISDTSMAASGTTKKITSNQILGAGGTATLASATISGDLTVDTSTLKVDSTNNRVGIGTASPVTPLNIGTAVSRHFLANGQTTGSSYGEITTTGGDAIYGVVDAAAGLFTGAIANASFFGTGNATPLQLLTNSISRATLDSSGNLGLGVTPSAWSGYKAIGVVNQGFNIYSSTTLSVGGITSNGYYNGSNWLYLNSASSGRYEIAGNSHQWYTAPSGTAGNAITFTQAMTLDASGNLVIGTTSAAARFHVEGGGAQARFSIASASDARHEYYRNGIREGLITWDANVIGMYATQSSGEVVIASSNTIRARVKAGGQVRFVPLASDPAGAEAGDVYYNSSSNKLKCYNGTTWNDLF